MLARIRLALVQFDRAVFASESTKTETDKVEVRRDAARTSVHARHGIARIQVDFAALSFEPGGACAVVVGHEIDALGSVLARIGVALVDLDRAVFRGESRCALAGEVGLQIRALTVVLARVRIALIRGLVAVNARKPRVARADAAFERVATRAVYTGICAAVVDFDFAALAGVSRWADALEIRQQVDALGVAYAWIRVALVDLDGAVFARVSRCAGAREVQVQVRANAAVFAGLGVALVRGEVAVLARVSFVARAGVPAEKRSACSEGARIEFRA